jgi:hypothetical protein
MINKHEIIMSMSRVGARGDPATATKGCVRLFLLSYGTSHKYGCQLKHL